MSEQAKLKIKIYELDFAIHELVLFLDTHKDSEKAMRLMDEYRKKRCELVEKYEAEYGPYIVTPADVPLGGCWKWIDGPWPWDNNFLEG